MISNKAQGAKICLGILVFGLACSPVVAAVATEESLVFQDEEQGSAALPGTETAVDENLEKPDSPNPTEESVPEPTEGATSFSTLCGNGQGKPGENEVRKKRKGLFGLADRMSAATRKIPLIGDFMVDSANSLSQTLACRLYPEEQKQAAEATEQVVRSEEVGKTVEWQSSVRDNVSGSSTIAAKNRLANGTPCLTITDVAIVDGDELRVSKKMCKLPGAHRYTVVNT